MERLTYRCNSCNSDVSPNATVANAALLCTNCNSPLPSNPNPNHLDQNPSPLSPPPFVDPLIPTTTSDSTTNFPFSTVTASDDNFLLDSPHLHRLIHHLTNSNESSPSTTTTTTTTTTTSRYHSPTSKSAIEAIPTVTITSAFLDDTDPIVLCAVCKDQFVIDDVAKQLPCKHMYHPDCILPWLSQHNSCPTVEVDVLPDSDQSVSGWQNWPVNGGAANAGWVDDDDVTSFGRNLHLNALMDARRLIKALHLCIPFDEMNLLQMAGFLCSTKLNSMTYP
ncbi:hypothetical protein L1987_59129 [Smallanthus sonchifolius]|uniref:Uncharacterized protein n=1 Tax=Smallanthus sonchifolius TaxID=185202 RepID=A0ACB9D4U0_9ASTR|nr:hypothetical protein L1987_59129 [Smallanthus sonchifolius]